MKLFSFPRLPFREEEFGEGADEEGGGGDEQDPRKPDVQGMKQIQLNTTSML